VGHTLRSTDFFEAGLNLTDEGLGGKCFSTFLSDTRSSTSLTATIFDFSRGTLGECTSGIETTPQNGAGEDLDTTEIGTDARVTVRDHADITVTGQDDFTGKAKFFLCGPLDLSSTSNCQTGGVQIGDPAVGEDVTGTGGTASVNSDDVVLTSVGRYCWRAEFLGDGDVPDSVDPEDDENVSECFSVTPLTPTLTTSAGPDVVLGNAIGDTATLSGTAKQPGTDGLGDGSIGASAATQANADGTITFSLVGPDDCVNVPTGFVDIDVTVDGDSDADTEYTASFTPGAVGEYTWIAVYDGDSPNTNGAGPTGCPDADEAVIVTGTSSLATDQDWLPNDTATITGDTDLSGTATFTLFTGSDCGAGDDDTAVYGPVDVPVSGASPQTASTSNSTLILEADSGSYSWLVSYDDDTLDDPADSCETTDITIDDTP
jgi:hypothetical protein